MQFVILGYDAKDTDALNRRMAVREDHLKLARENYKNNKLLFAAGLFDDSEKMIGSNMIMQFDSRTDLDDYLKNEPYVTGKVWEKIKIIPAKVPSFFKK